MEGKILEIGTDLPEMEEEILEIQGFRVIPGFVEIHMHGAVGVDVNAADAEGFEKIGRFLATQGVTGWLCSILTDTEEQTLKCIHEYRRWKELPHWGAELMGIHLEGPFLGEKYKGAMPPHLIFTNLSGRQTANPLPVSIRNWGNIMNFYKSSPAMKKK